MNWSTWIWHRRLALFLEPNSKSHQPWSYPFQAFFSDIFSIWVVNISSFLPSILLLFSSGPLWLINQADHIVLYSHSANSLLPTSP